MLMFGHLVFEFDHALYLLLFHFNIVYLRYIGHPIYFLKTSPKKKNLIHVHTFEQANHMVLVGLW